MISEINVRVLPKQAANEKALRQYLQEEKGIDTSSLSHIRILKRSIDARQRTIYVNLLLRLYVNEEPTDDEYAATFYPDVSGRRRAIVVGAGPGGLFAALRLIELGICPVVIERGKNVHERRKDIALISTQHIVDAESNYSFGEGGAGAFSDGKLYTRSKKRGNVEKILNVFCQHGASTNILIDAHPHIGTDKLPRVIENMRERIISCGGEVHFNTKMTGIITKEDKVIGIEYVSQDPGLSAQGTLTGPVILATGHSARDVYRYLYTNAIEIEAKDIAVGVRLEHPSELINSIQYHLPYKRQHVSTPPYLPTAEYSFVTQVEGLGVYSFCMCPGGTVVPAASGPEQVVVNGMSSSHRNSPWSNAGLVVETKVNQITDDSSYPLCMMEFQESLEKLCWQQGGRTQVAPAQRMVDFVNGHLSADLPRTSYSPGVLSSPLHFWMPDFISTRLQQAFKEFGRRSRGFLTNEAMMIGVETRTSAPVRILRDRETLQHVRLEGLYPCGEGAGYAGGIVSAAVDGERCAEQLAEKYK